MSSREGGIEVLTSAQNPTPPVNKSGRNCGYCHRQGKDGNHDYLTCRFRAEDPESQGFGGWHPKGGFIADSNFPVYTISIVRNMCAKLFRIPVWEILQHFLVPVSRVGEQRFIVPVSRVGGVAKLRLQARPKIGKNLSAYRFG